MYNTGGAVDICHVIQMIKNVIRLPVLEVDFYPITTYLCHFLVLVDEINMFFLEKPRI